MVTVVFRAFSCQQTLPCPRVHAGAAATATPHTCSRSELWCLSKVVRQGEFTENTFEKNCSEPEGYKGIFHGPEVQQAHAKTDKTNPSVSEHENITWPIDAPHDL